VENAVMSLNVDDWKRKNIDNLLSLSNGFIIYEMPEKIKFTIYIFLVTAL
jgi:hypothetical protein